MIELDSEAGLESAIWCLISIRPTTRGCFSSESLIVTDARRVLAPLNQVTSNAPWCRGEPAVEHVGGVEALASQVTQLFMAGIQTPSRLEVC